MKPNSTPHCIPMPEPETFAGLMEIYETNYINIRRLCGNLSLLDAWVISQVKTGLDLHLKIGEGSADDGGPFRDSLTNLAEEI